MQKNNKIEIFNNQVLLLRDLFFVQDDLALNKLNNAVKKFCYFTFEIDKFIDDDDQSESLSEIMIHHQKAIVMLRELFDDNSPFWDILEKHTKIYFDILEKEKKHSKTKPSYSIIDFENYAIAKHTLAFVPIEAMNLIFGSKCDVEILKELFFSLFLGIQMNDDLEDFSRDESNQQWTFLRSKVSDYIHENKIEVIPEMPKFSERVLYVSRIGVENLSYAKNKFLEAKNLAEKINFDAILPLLYSVLKDLEDNETLILNLLKK